MNWTDCLSEGLVRQATPDHRLAKALQKAVRDRLVFAKKLPLDEQTARFALVEHYEALRTQCEALLAAHGFKVYNHACMADFLKEIMGLERIARTFDRARQLRNRINYYGSELSKAEAVALIVDVDAAIEQLGRRLEDMYKSGS